MFTRAANFSNIAVENLYVTAFVHKAYVAVNENGTEAAAATGNEVYVSYLSTLNYFLHCTYFMQKNHIY